MSGSGGSTPPCQRLDIPVSLKYVIIATNQEEEAKLLYGMLFSMKSFVAKLSPNDMKQGFLSYVTSAYR